MTARLTSAVLVSSLIRRLASLGGNGVVLAKGDEMAGGILLLIANRGVLTHVRERGLNPDGQAGWIETGPRELSDPVAVRDYCDRRRKFDSDLWIVELDHEGRGAELEQMLQD